MQNYRYHRSCYFFHNESADSYRIALHLSGKPKNYNTMVKKTFKLFLILVGMITMAACTSGTQKEATKTDPMDLLLNKYVQVSLTADISHLSANEKEMLSLLFKAATIMDDISGHKILVQKMHSCQKLKIQKPVNLQKSIMAHGTNLTTKNHFWKDSAQCLQEHSFIRLI
jgi:hypothetical protein